MIICGAAGRDFHVFNTCFRGEGSFEVVAFTATQIPNISERKYPSELAGELYPDGVPIFEEAQLGKLIQELHPDQVILAYSDVPHVGVMHLASEVLAAGPDFRLVGPQNSQLKSSKPVVAITATRTGCGKSQTTRRVADILSHSLGFSVVVVRHPMPYGDLAAQAVQRFGGLGDLDTNHCTVEEREEYEQHLNKGITVFAGVDYERILRAAELEADFVLWDGGNNDFSFYQPDLSIVVADPHRAGHEVAYHPGESNLRVADVVVINKIDSASPRAVQEVRNNVHALNPEALVVDGASPVFMEGPCISDKDVLVIEDGPTLTHGGMAYGAGFVAAMKYGAKKVVDPRTFAKGTVADAFSTYKNIGNVLPAMGYDEVQLKDLEETIQSTPCDIVIIATPINLQHLIRIDKECCRVRYELQEIGTPTLYEILQNKFGTKTSPKFVPLEQPVSPM